MANWNPNETPYSKILADIFRNMSSENLHATNGYAYDQNRQLQYVDPNPPAPPGTIDLTFQEIKEDELPKS